MSVPSPPPCAPGFLAACFRSGDGIRSRSVSKRVLSATLALPDLPPRLVADWKRETSLHLQLEPGDIETLSLTRARARWPEYKDHVHAVSAWMTAFGLRDELASCNAALMVCRGTPYHHDAAQYGGAAFCNLFLGEDKDLDLHFPFSGHRIPLTRGTVVIFDTGQAHAVIRRHSAGFAAADFSPGNDDHQFFLTWELPVERPDVAHALGISFDIDASTPPQLDEEQLWWNGAPAHVRPDSGQWCRDDPSPGNAEVPPTD